MKGIKGKMEEIDLKELFNIIWERKNIILVVVLVAMILGIIYTTFFVTPKYEASTKLVLVSNNSGTNSQTGAITQTDLTLNSNLVSTYSVIIKSDSVLSKVIENLELTDFTEENLKKCISVSEIEDAEVVKISVTNENPKYAYKIANEMAVVFREKAEELYKISNIEILDTAKLPEQPYNVNSIKDIIIFIVGGLVIGIVFVFIINMLDDTVKNVEDIERITKLPVLATIPNGANDRKRSEIKL